MDAATMILPDKRNADIEKLKRKCNLLIDEVGRRDKEISTLQKENRALKDSLEKANSMLVATKAEKQDNKCAELVDFIGQFINIIYIAVEQDLIIPFTYNSRNAKDYEKIDTQDFRRLIEKYAKMDKHKFFDYCGIFRLLGRRKNGRMSAGADNTMVYMIPRTIVEYIRKSQEQEKEA